MASPKKSSSLGSGPGQSDDLDPDFPGPGDGGPISVEGVAEVGDSDPVADAYLVPGEDFRVELFRHKPTLWRGQDIGGFVDELAPEDSFSTIKARYGGGTFRIVRRDLKTGKMMWARVFKIAGVPVLSSTPDDSQTPPLVPTKNPDHPGATIDLGGVSIPLTGDIADLQRMILFVKAIKHVFPDPPDYNQALLTALLEQRKTDDPLDLLGKLRTAVPEIFGGGGGDGDSAGGNLYSLLQEAIKQAGPIIGGLAARGPVVSRPMPARAAIPVTSARTEPTNPEPVNHAAPESEGDPVAQGPNSQQIAVMAVGEIVKAFAMEPPQAAADVVNGLDLVTGIQAADRHKLAPFKGALQSMAERNLPEYLEDVTPETVTNFRAYFSEVFDSFVNPDRAGL